MEGDRQRCIDAGCDGYTTKPIDREKFISLLAKYAFHWELDKSRIAAT